MKLSSLLVFGSLAGSLLASGAQAQTSQSLMNCAKMVAGTSSFDFETRINAVLRCKNNTALAQSHEQLQSCVSAVLGRESNTAEFRGRAAEACANVVDLSAYKFLTRVERFYSFDERIQAAVASRAEVKDQSVATISTVDGSCISFLDDNNFAPDKARDARILNACRRVESLSSFKSE